MEYIDASRQAAPGNEADQVTHLQELFLSDWKASKGSALFTSSEQVLQGASRCPVSGAWSLQRVAIDTLRLCTVVVPRLGIHRHAMPSSLHPHCHVGENPRVPQEPGFQPSPVTKTHSSEQTTMPAPYVLLGSCLVQLNHRYLAYPLSTPTPGHLGFFFFQSLPQILFARKQPSSLLSPK